MAVINALPQKTKSTSTGGEYSYVNPSWWDIKTIFENDKDIGNYPPTYYDYAPRIFLLTDDTDTTTFSESRTGPVRTSDGMFYDNGFSSVTHTWDKTQDKPCYINGKEVYKTRWVMCYKSTKPYQFYENIPFIYYYEDKSTMLLCTSQNYIYQRCYTLQSLPTINFSNNDTATSMFEQCYALKLNNSNIDLSGAKRLGNTFGNCASLEKIILKAGIVENFQSTFYNCYSLREVILDYQQASSWSSNGMFNSCYGLIRVTGLDVLNANNGYLFSNCKNLQYLDIKNIRINMTLGSGSSYGHKLTVDSLLNAIKETWDNTGNSTTLTLTIGSTNLSKLSNVYVKLIDITDEMRAEDPYIDNKKPFEVCESSDDKAMLITEYITSKNWQLA